MEPSTDLESPLDLLVAQSVQAMPWTRPEDQW